MTPECSKITFKSDPLGLCNQHLVFRGAENLHAPTGVPRGTGMPTVAPA